MENFHEIDIDVINKLGVNLYNTLTKYFILEPRSYNNWISYIYYGKVKDIRDKLGFLEKEIPENKKDEDIIKMTVYIKITCLDPEIEDFSSSDYVVDTLVSSSTKDKMENFNYSREALKSGILNNNFGLEMKLRTNPELDWTEEIIKILDNENKTTSTRRIRNPLPFRTSQYK